MSLGYPWGTYVPIGTYDRPDQEQAILDDLLADLVGLPTDEYYAAIAERMGVVIQQEETDPWVQFLIDQESPNV